MEVSIYAAADIWDVGQLFIWIAVFALLTWGAMHVIGKIRAATAQQEPPLSELMSKFRELHSRGELSDAEFRTIKTTLAAQLQQEIKDRDGSG